MVRRELAAAPEQAWCGTWWDCPGGPGGVRCWSSVLVPSAELIAHLRAQGPPCVTCRALRAAWPTGHRLYKPGLSQCLRCVEADINQDVALARRDDT
jgi:hypothetical protein